MYIWMRILCFVFLVLSGVAVIVLEYTVREKAKTEKIGRL